MRHSIRRRLRFLHAYALTTTLILLAIAVSAFVQPARPQNLEFLDADGKVVQRLGPDAR